MPPTKKLNQKFPNFLSVESISTVWRVQQLSIAMCLKVMAEYAGTILRQNFGSHRISRVQP